MSNNNLKFFKEETWLKTLVNNSFKVINNGYYEIKKNDFNFENHSNINLKRNLMNCITLIFNNRIKICVSFKNPVG